MRYVALRNEVSFIFFRDGLCFTEFCIDLCGGEMYGFSYDESAKQIKVQDTTFTVIWENVERNIAEEAAKLFGESKGFDELLIQNNCNRYWGYTAK